MKTVRPNDRDLIGHNESIWGMTLNLRLRTLVLIALLFSYAAVFLFVFGWIKTRISLPLCIALAAAIALVYRSWKDRDEYLVLSLWMTIGATVLFSMWCLLGGLGGYAEQGSDWLKHNAMLNDLIKYQWPVIYDENAMLCYYIGYYLLPALVGKIAGADAAQQMMLAQTVIGLVLVYCLVCKIAGGGGYSLGKESSYHCSRNADVWSCIYPWINAM